MIKSWSIFIVALFTLCSPMTANAQEFILEKINLKTYSELPKEITSYLQIYSYVDLESTPKEQLPINNSNKLNCLKLINELVKQGISDFYWDYRIIVGVDKNNSYKDLRPGKYIEIISMPVPVNIPKFFSTDDKDWTQKVIAAIASNQTLNPDFVQKNQDAYVGYSLWTVNKVEKIIFSNGPFVMIHTSRVGEKDVKYFFGIPEYQYKSLKWAYSVGHKSVMWQKDKNELTDSIVLSFLNMKSPSFKHVDWEDRKAFGFPFNNSNYIKEMESKFKKYQKTLSNGQDITFTLLPINTYLSTFQRKTASFKIEQEGKVKMVHFIMTDDGFGVWREKNI